MNKLKISLRICRTYFLQKTFQLRVKPHKAARLQISFPFFGLLPFLTKNNTNDAKQSISDIISKADDLFEDEDYLEVYNLLTKYKDDKNVEICWRISRALYKLTKTNEFDNKTNRAMLLEAYDLISKCLEWDNKNADVHKWTAILLDAKTKLERKHSKFIEVFQVKEHLMEAHRLNPDDYTVLFMLGKWYYTMSNLSWLQRKIATVFYTEPPKCDYEDALHYFLKAEELKPRYNLSNIYMLGKINYQMGNMYRAHYYLKIASQMTPHCKQEEKCVLLAQNLAKKLKNYEMKDEVL